MFLFLPFSSFRLLLLLHLAPHLLADPPGSHGPLAECRGGVGNRNSIPCTETEKGQQCVSTGLSEWQWRNIAPVAFARLLSQAGLHSGLRPTLTPLPMRLPCFSFRLQILPFLPFN